jgi:solute carrier family 25 uncoupling protein 8/9
MAPNNNMGDPNLPLPLKMITAGFAASLAEILTIPLDTAKVRLQIQLKGSSGPKYLGMSNCISTMLKEEGVSSLYKGLNAGL